MKSFPTKAPGERRIYWVGLDADDAPGATYVDGSPGPTIRIEVYERSSVDDPRPGDMLDDDPVVSPEVIVIEQQPVPIKRALGQWIKGGIPGCIYLVTYESALSDGQIFVEQVLLKVAKHVP